MKNKNILLLVLLFLVCILSISAISATANEDAISTDNNDKNNVETINQHDDVSTSDENFESSLDENDDDEATDSRTDKITVSNDNSLSFTDLNTIINGNNNSTIYLSNDYKYDKDKDSEFKDGIVISRDLIIYGNEVTIDGNEKARIFKVNEKVNVEFHNIKFIKGKAEHGGALEGGKAYNCTFKNNQAEIFGGAMNGGTAYDCIFYKNEATSETGRGGAMYGGNAYNCNFTENKIKAYYGDGGGAMCNGNAYNCTFTKNVAEESDGGAIKNGDAYNCTFINNSASYGGAIHEGNANGCTFIENEVMWHGSAVYKGTAINCTFTKNKADGGGAISWGDAYNCTFIANTGDYYPAMNDGKAYNCNFIENTATEKDDSVGGAIGYCDAYNCTFTNNTSIVYAGAMYKSNAYDCIFTGNKATYGGAIYLGNATNCIFESNSADDNGGALNQANAYNCTFKNNKASDHGGAIYGGNASHCTFTENKAGENGGAIYQGNVYNCTFTENIAEEDGGAINNVNAYNCTFTNNNAKFGGAIYQGNVYNCTFKGNNATNGGAIMGGNAYNCTFSGNTATSKGGAINVGEAYDSIFTNNNATDGGAMNDGKATKCTFINNSAVEKGGALYEIDAVACVFRNNTASLGQAMYGGKAVLCMFYNDTTNETTILPVNISAINYTSTYRSGEKFYFYIMAKGTSYSGINATIAIFKNDGSFVKNVTALSSVSNDEGGWVVDLEPGEYNVELTLPNYPEETASANATINVSKANPTLFIDPINDTEVGNEIIINYTTNSTGNVTIRVNGTTLTEDRKYTPNQPGIYNVTIEVAEDQYYLAATNETTFTVGKIDPFLVISPIATVPVGQEVTILFTSNSNGTVTVKVNGTVVPGTAGENGTVLYNFTPDSEGIYNVTVEIAGNEYFNAVSNETTFTVGGERINAFVEITPITNATVGEELTINYTTNSNSTVTIKVNGTEISGNKYTPNAEGVYNVTIEVAENEWYTAAYNETTFTVVGPEKINTTIIISPISHVLVGEEVQIQFICNSNATAVVKVNGTEINGTEINGTVVYNYTPNAEGIYNVSVEVAENQWYTAAYNETTFNVGKIDPFLVINPIATVPVGQVVSILFTSNSNGTVTVKVNGTVVPGTAGENGTVLYNFTPDSEGIYNVTVEIAGNEYYNAVSNETTFTVGKIDPFLVISPIATVPVGHVVSILFTSNSNGTVTVKVNGTVVPGTAGENGTVLYNFTPDSEGIYNVTVEIAGNEYYNAVSNETTFTVGKIDPYLSITPISDVTVGEVVSILFTSNSNGTVTVKVNGTVVPGTAGENGTVYNFTPDSDGIYNVTVEIAGNEYYNAVSNETTFTVGKIDPYLSITPISDVTVGEVVSILFTSNSNGTVTVKVNGTVVPGTAGENGTVYNFTPDSEGIYNVTVEIAGNDYFNAVSNETTFTVGKIDPFLVISPIATVPVGHVVSILFTSNSNGTVTVKVNGTVVPGTAGENGTVLYNFTPDSEGIYNVTVEIAGNDYYNAVSNETTFTVGKIDPSLVITPIADVTVGQVVNITFSTESNGTVTIKVNGTTLANTTFTPDSEGIYNVTVEIAGNDYYNAVSNETTVNVVKTKATVSINPITNAIVGHEVPISFFTNSNGTVTISVNGEPISGGKFIPPTKGSYYVTIEVAENDYYTAATNHTKFRANKEETSIVVRPITTTYDAVKDLTISLKDAEGRPLKAKVLTVTILGKSHNYVTDSNGQVKIKVPTSAPKPYTVRIKYGGSDQFKVSSASVKVTVKKATPKITAKNARFKAKTLTKKYTITLKNQNKVIKNKKVTLSVNGKTYTTKTNSKGQATFKITNLSKKGTYNAVITASGNYYYNEVTKRVKISVRK